MSFHFRISQFQSVSKSTLWETHHREASDKTKTETQDMSSTTMFTERSAVTMMTTTK